MIVQCLECGLDFYAQKTDDFCSDECMEQYLAAWKHILVKGHPGALVVHHIDGDPTNNNPDNIRLVRARENRRS